MSQVMEIPEELAGKKVTTSAALKCCLMAQTWPADRLTKSSWPLGVTNSTGTGGEML